MSGEIELKLEADPRQVSRLREQPWLLAADQHSEKQSTVYFDTPDGKVRQCGYSLRVRRVGDRRIQTVKALDGGAGLFQRGEWECAIDGNEPDLSRLHGTPLADADLNALEPVVESKVKRTACRLSDEDAQVEVDVDEGSIRAGGHKLAVSEIEIELVRGEPEAAVALARRIAADVPVKLSVLSKVERGFALADDALSRPSKAGPVAMDRKMSVAEGFETVVTACLRHFRLNEPLVIEDRHPEGLHQARVAIRRLRAAFSLFRPAITDTEFKRIEDELRCFMTLLGEARNLDVYLQRDLGGSERGAMEEQREQAYDSVIHSMDSPRFRRLMIDLVAWTTLGEWRRKGKAGKPIRPFVDKRITRLWKQVSGTRKLPGLAPPKLHHLRIRGKKLRYALDFTEALHSHAGKRRKKFAKVIEELQESLGHLNDANVAQSLSSSLCWPLPARPVSPAKRRACLGEAKRSLRKLRKIGAYWRSG